MWWCQRPGHSTQCCQMRPHFLPVHPGCRSFRYKLRSRNSPKRTKTYNNKISIMGQNNRKVWLFGLLAAVLQVPVCWRSGPHASSGPVEDRSSRWIWWDPHTRIWRYWEKRQKYWVWWREYTPSTASCLSLGHNTGPETQICVERTEKACVIKGFKF